MEIICVICKHTDRTEEQRERHVQTAEHIRNDEIYTMGLEHGQQHGKKQIATLEARVKELEKENTMLKSEVSALSTFGTASVCKSCKEYYPNGYVCGCGRDNSYTDAEWAEVTK